MRNWLVIAATAAALLFSACATYESYENPALAGGQVAVLSGTDAAVSADLLRVDGASCRLMGNRVTVTPGEHAVDFRIGKKMRGATVPIVETYEHTLMFEAQAGHSYTLVGEFEAEAIHVWIADDATGEPVATVRLKRV